MQSAAVVEVDVGAADTGEQHGVFGVVLGHIKRVDRTTRFIELGAGGLWLIGDSVYSHRPLSVYTSAGPVW